MPQLVEKYGRTDHCSLQVRAVVEGRASAWQKHLTLTPTKPGASEAVSLHPRHRSLPVCKCLCRRRVPHMSPGLLQDRSAFSAAQYMRRSTLMAFLRSPQNAVMITPCFAAGRGAGGGGGGAHL